MLEGFTTLGYLYTRALLQHTFKKQVYKIQCTGVTKCIGMEKRGRIKKGGKIPKRCC